LNVFVATQVVALAWNPGKKTNAKIAGVIERFIV